MRDLSALHETLFDLSSFPLSLFRLSSGLGPAISEKVGGGLEIRLRSIEILITCDS